MKNYLNYIKESNLSIEDEIRNELLKHCKPFIDEVKGTDMLLWRGFEEYIEHYEIIDKPEFRKPLDTSHDIHTDLNELTSYSIGWGVRNGVFTTTNKMSASIYGEEYIFMPIGYYEYAYNPDIVDLTDKVHSKDYLGSFQSWYFFTYEKHRDIKQDGEPPEVTDEIKDKYIEEYNAYMEKLADGYITEDLKSARDIEISFNVESYYLINKYYEKLVLELIK